MSGIVHLDASSSTPLSPRTKPAPKFSKIPLIFSYTPSDDGTDENLLILLHGLGDSHTPFAKLGRSLRLPQTAILALRAPEQIPYLYEQAFQWYTSFDFLGEIIERPNPTAALEVVIRVLGYLVLECTWPPNRIHLLGFGQGGSVAAETALAWWKQELASLKTMSDPADSESVPSGHHLGSIVSVSGPLLSYPTLATPCPTPLLSFSRAALRKDASTAFSKGFTHTRQVVKPGTQGEESMPHSRDEWEPVMRFWSEVLGRRVGDGLYEVMTDLVDAIFENAPRHPVWYQTWGLSAMSPMLGLSVDAACYLIYLSLELGILPMLSRMSTPSDYPGDLEYTRPADKIKAVNVPDVPEEIFTGMKAYEDAARGFDLYGFERTTKTTTEEVQGGIFLSHRPEDAQVSQVYKISTDPENTELERLTYFNIGSGRIISTFRPIVGDDWRGVYRPGGAIMSMDFNGNEHFQLWRYWEDALSEHVLPKIDGELENAPGKGRIERITHDDYRYNNIVTSPSNKLVAFVSNKENNTDTLAYLARLIGSDTGATSDSRPFSLPSRLITPLLRDGKTERWVTQSISVDDKYLLLTRAYGNAYQTMFVVDISAPEPGKLERIVLPGATEHEEKTTVNGTFSFDPANPHVIYVVTDAYGDFDAIVSYDISQRTVTHITTSTLDPSVPVLKPIAWKVGHLGVTEACIYFIANVEGWSTLYAMPLSGPNENVVVEVKAEWEGGWISYSHDGRNRRPYELALRLASYRSRGFIRKAVLDLQTLKYTPNGDTYVDVKLTPYTQAAAPEVERAVAPKLIRFRSFDGLEVPAFYYHPNEGNGKAPVVIGIHGGPESQATVQYRTATHGYLLNELGIAVIYPNVRGSSGYGRKYMSLDDIEKREDAVKDIGALIDYIGSGLSGELDPFQIAVMGGSYGGYMVFATLTYYSSKLKCGVSNFGIGNWVTFLENTAPVRRANRRLEYGDESDPVIRAFLEHISPLNNAKKIGVPLFITHGETDTRVPVGEAVAMYKIVQGNLGGWAQLVICEGEGHGYKQKSVVEYVNAATIDYLKRHLLSYAGEGGRL